MALERRQTHSRSIRLLLVGMFAIPLVSLTALWGFAADITLSSAIKDHNYNSANRAISPAIQPVLIQLGTERQESYVWLLTGRRSPTAALDATRQRTDRAIAAARSAYASVRTLLSAQGQAGLSGLYGALGEVGQIRVAVNSGAMSPVAAFQAYSGIADYVLHYMKGAPQADVGSLYQATIGAMDSDYALEMAAREAALAGAALAIQQSMSDPGRQLFASTVASRRLLTGDALALLNPTLRATYAVALAQDKRLTPLEDQISAAQGSRRGPLPVNAAAWQSAMGRYLSAMQQAQNQNIALLSAMSVQLSDRLVTEAALAGGAGLAAVIVSVVLLVWLGRSVTSDLTGLLGNVRAMAEERLPRVVEKLRRGDEVDVAAESPPPRTGTITEIAQIAQSFAMVQAAAVEAAVHQAKLRKGVSQVFLNLSMRNQSLLHRQLSVLDAMERRTNDPDTLGDLFRLDHLTTRMRRHAEGLIILAGVAPARGWREPVPVVDVLRASIAEVEDYVRVDMVSESSDSVAGAAVTDVIHLIAELVENATAFSPPDARIEVRADRVGNGLVAEIEDRGLGLSDDELVGINQRLANPPEFDLANSDQLGLFVVGRLAARHGIKVALRQSPYGGVTAIVLLPLGVVLREDDGGVPAAMAGDARGTQPGMPARMDPSPPAPSPSADHAGGQRRAFAFSPTGRHRIAPLPDQGSSQPGPFGHGAAGPDVARTDPAPPWEIPGWEPAGWQPSGRVPGEPMTGENQVSSVRQQDRPGPVTASTHLGMPIRVPQESIAPQLRNRPGKEPAAQEASEPSKRSPEATRLMLFSMQQGWQRGRLDDLDDPDDPDGSGIG